MFVQARQVANALSCPHEAFTLKGDTLAQDMFRLLLASDFLVESRSAQVVEVLRFIRPLAANWFTGGLFNATFSSLWRDDGPNASRPGRTFQELILSRGSSEERFDSAVGRRFGKMARESVVAACVKSNASFAEATPADSFERFMISSRHRGFYNASHAFHRPGESRLLMCDYDLLDFFLRIPAELRYHKKLYEHLLRTKWPGCPTFCMGIPALQSATFLPQRTCAAKNARVRSAGWPAGWV